MQLLRKLSSLAVLYFEVNSTADYTSHKVCCDISRSQQIMHSEVSAV